MRVLSDDKAAMADKIGKAIVAVKGAVKAIVIMVNGKLVLAIAIAIEDLEAFGLIGLIELIKLGMEKLIMKLIMKLNDGKSSVIGVDMVASVITVVSPVSVGGVAAVACCCSACRCRLASID